MLGASKLLIFLLNDDDNMQGGESCRNICVVPFSLCKTTTLRVELPLLLCNVRKRHQILIIVNIITVNSAIINSVCSLSSLWLTSWLASTQHHHPRFVNTMIDSFHHQPHQSWLGVAI